MPTTFGRRVGRMKMFMGLGWGSKPWEAPGRALTPPTRQLALRMSAMSLMGAILRPVRGPGLTGPTQILVADSYKARIQAPTPPVSVLGMGKRGHLSSPSLQGVNFHSELEKTKVAPKPTEPTCWAGKSWARKN